MLLFVSSFLQSELDATPFVRGGLTELEALRDMGTDGAAAFTAATQRYIASQRHLIFLQVGWGEKGGGRGRRESISYTINRCAGRW